MEFKHGVDTEIKMVAWYATMCEYIANNRWWPGLTFLSKHGEKYNKECTIT